MDLYLIISDSEQRAVEEWGTYMKRNTVIFECSGIGPKMLYSGSLGSKNLSKFSFRVLELFRISTKTGLKVSKLQGHMGSFEVKS